MDEVAMTGMWALARLTTLEEQNAPSVVREELERVLTWLCAAEDVNYAAAWREGRLHPDIYVDEQWLGAVRTVRELYRGAYIPWSWFRAGVQEVLDRDYTPVFPGLKEGE